MNNLIIETRLQELIYIIENKLQKVDDLDNRRRQDLVRIQEFLGKKRSLIEEVAGICNSASITLRDLRSRNQDKRLSTELDDLRGMLTQISEKLRDLPDAISAFDDHLKDWISCLVLVSKQSERLGWSEQLAQQATTNIKTESDSLRGEICALRERLQAGDKDSGLLWNDYQRDVFDKSQDLFREYIDFVRGLTLRDTKLDEQIGFFADQLLNPIEVFLERHHSITIPAGHEALKETIGRIIRLRFPEWTIWALPLIAHEYAYILAKTNPFPELIREVQSSRPAERGYIDDYFADIIATYIMGPAYACATVMLRLDPLRKAQKIDPPAERQTRREHGDQIEQPLAAPPESWLGHPSDIRRAQIIFQTLRWMERRYNAELKGFTDIVEGHWNNLLGETGKQAEASETQPTDTQQLIEVVGRKIDSALTGVRYPTSQRCGPTIQWKDALLERLKNGDSEPLRIGAITDLRDLLNGAWWARLDHLAKLIDDGHAQERRDEDIRKLGIWTYEAIKELVEGRTPSKGEPYNVQRS